MVLRLGTGDAYALLEALLRTEYGLERLPALARDGGGKPFFPARPELRFNVSHSGGLILCGAGAAAVGVDVERIRPRRTGLPRHVLSPEEYAWFVRQGGGWERFYTLWTLKEARVKCTGAGLSGPARAIAVPLLAPGQGGTLDGLRFRAYGGDGWRAAVCCAPPEQPPEEVPGQSEKNVSFSCFRLR